MDGPVLAFQEQPSSSNSRVDIFAPGESFDGTHAQMCSRTMNKKLYYVPVVEKTHVLEGATEPAPRRKILLLDDEAAFADLTRTILEENG